jgi:hypothetical protein
MPASSTPNDPVAPLTVAPGVDPAVERNAAIDDLMTPPVKPNRTGRIPQVAVPGTTTPRPGEGCFGTRVQFLDGPAEAAEVAARERKLLFVLNLSGDFEDSRFT